jgi:hypothetical protein
VLRIRSALALATHDFFARRGFLHVHTPVLTTCDAEGAGDAFTVHAPAAALPAAAAAAGAEGGGAEGGGAEGGGADFFGAETYLTVSGAPVAAVCVGEGRRGRGRASESFLRVDWVAVPEAMRARRVNTGHGGGPLARPAGWLAGRAVTRVVLMLRG